MEFPEHFTVAYVPLKHYFEFNNSGSNHIFGGIDGRLFQTLFRVFNFKYTLVSPPDLEWGRKRSDGTWSGMIGMIERGEADIALSRISQTDERLQVVDFSTPYQYTAMTFFSNFPEEIRKVFITIYPFQMKLWLAVMVLVIMISLFFYFIALRKQPYIIWLLEIFANLLGKTQFKRPKANLLRALWGFTALILSLSYTSVLLSMFFLPLREPPVRNFEELFKAVKFRGFKVLVIKGSNALYLLRNANRVELAEKIEGKEWFFNPRYFDPDFKLEGKTAYMYGAIDSYLIYGFPPRSLKFISDDTFGTDNIAVAMRKDIGFKEKFNLVIKNMVQFGIIDKYFNEEVFRRRMSITGAIEERNNDDIALSLEHMYGTFLALVIGHSFATIVLIIEITVWNMTKNS